MFTKCFGFPSALIAATLVAATLTTAQATPAPLHQILADLTPTATADFYTPPPVVPTAPGTLIRSETIPHAFNMVGAGQPGHAQRMLYSSIDSTGTPVAVSGYVIEPLTPWPGPGPTPTIVFAAGTRGQGDNCAPSRSTFLVGTFDPTQGTVGANYELATHYRTAAMGVRVVTTDYMGLGTPGTHGYVNATEEGRAVLDAARAAHFLTEAAPGTPVGLYGYSQGGGAVAAAGEIAPSYAPELPIAGIFAGAPPADLPSVLKQVDGSLMTGVLGMAINGFAEKDPEFQEAIDDLFTPEGHQFLATVRDSCLSDTLLKVPFADSGRFTVTGQPLSEALYDHPVFLRVLGQQKLGRQPISAPIFISASTGDDIIPYGQVRQLAHDYCTRGGTVVFRPVEQARLTPEVATGVNHLMPTMSGDRSPLMFLIQRFEGKPVTSTCNDLPSAP